MYVEKCLPELLHFSNIGNSILQGVWNHLCITNSSVCAILPRRILPRRKCYATRAQVCSQHLQSSTQRGRRDITRLGRNSRELDIPRESFYSLYMLANVHQICATPSMIHNYRSKSMTHGVTARRVNASIVPGGTPFALGNRW